MKKFNGFKLGLVALLICSATTAFSDDSFEWHGYVRAGTGLTSEDSVEGVNENKLGRLGNEYNTWMNSSFIKRFESESGAWVKLELETFGWVEDSYVVGPWAGNDEGTDKGAVYIGQNNLKFGGLDFLPEDAVLTVGKFGIVSDIHILDYKYKRFEGTGVHYKNNNLDLGIVSNESSNINAIDFGYQIGSLETRVTASKQINIADNEESNSAVSLLLNYNHPKFLGFLDGSTNYIAQVGKGVVAEHLNETDVDDKDYRSMRLLVDAHSDTGTWILNPVIMFEANDRDTSENETSLVIGGRFTRQITNQLEFMSEGFVNNVKNKNGVDNSDGTQYKIAAGPAIQIEMGEWVRPVARFTITYLGGEKKITGLTKDSEVRYGMQYEAWF